MKQVTSYETSDGRRFQSFEEAEVHENVIIGIELEVYILEQLSTVGELDIPTMDLETKVRFITKYRASLLEILLEVERLETRLTTERGVEVKK